jgi:hypothetical protein
MVANGMVKYYKWSSNNGENGVKTDSTLDISSNGKCMQMSVGISGAMDE